MKSPAIAFSLEWANFFGDHESRQTANRSTAAFPRHRITIPKDDHSWAEEVSKQLDTFTKLRLGWDGYRGVAVSFQTARFVADMLSRLCQQNVPAPVLVPGGDGSLQVEWHRNGYDVEIDVSAPHVVTATRFNLETEEEEVIEIQNNFLKVYEWIEQLSDDIADSKQG